MSVYSLIQLSAFVDQMHERLSAIETQLAVVSEKVGVPYDAPTSGVPQDVIDLARSGDRLGAIKRYRELTGSGLDEARDAIAGL